MKEFWDAKASEDPFFFVDNRLSYGDPDLERFWTGGEELVQKILDTLGTEIRPADDIVDIGCGVGRLTRALAERGATVAAIDVSPRMIERAAELNRDLENVQWTVGDGSSLSVVASGAADVCFSFVVFQHIPDPRITLGYVREMGRVLRPGGWAAFQVSNKPRAHTRMVGRRAQLRALLRRGHGGQAHPAWLGSAVDLDELRETAAGAGMDLEKVIGEGEQYCLVLLRRSGR
jgi:SAM-dependent methyltransferase